MKRLSALLTTEGTYPFHAGDVSRWCQALTTGLDRVDFTLLAVTTHPCLAPRGDMPANVVRLVTVPLSGMDDPAEFGNHASAIEYAARRAATTSGTVEEEYVPHLERFLRQVTQPLEQPRALGLTLMEMHLHLRYYDYHRTQTHPAAWDAFVRAVLQAWSGVQPAAPSPGTAELLAAWRFLYRALLPLAVDIPHFDLAHATAPGFCALPCVVARLRWRTPFLITEHGGYLRNHHVTAGRAVPSPFVRWFASRLTSAIVNVSYAVADRISPVCERTAQWERWQGVQADRIVTIPPGVPPAAAVRPSRETGAPPVVVSAGVFAPLEGQLLLIEAAAIVRRSCPGVEFRLTGVVEDRTHHQRCLDLVKALGLEQTVSLTTDPPDPRSAVAQGHVAVVPAAPDGIPFALLDAMMAGAPIVAVDEGGTADALGATGMLVPPSDPVALAEAIGALLQNPDSGRQLGAHARERALELFTESRFLAEYEASYERVARTTERSVIPWRAREDAPKVPRGEEVRPSYAGRAT